VLVALRDVALFRNPMVLRLVPRSVSSGHAMLLGRRSAMRRLCMALGCGRVVYGRSMVMR
jgi:hypothetical protein